MGWVSFVEDLKKRLEGLENEIDSVRSGERQYIDGNRAKVVDIGREIRQLVGNLESTLRNMGIDEKEALDEILFLRDSLQKLEKEKEWLSSELKKAHLKISELRESEEGEKRKAEFIINKFKTGGPEELRSYLRKLKKYP